MTVLSNDTLAGELPLKLDLQWVQGDNVDFAIYFKGVNWNDPNPGLEGQPTWVQTTWQSQVRNPYWYMAYRNDMWVPAYGYQESWWRAQSGVITFAMMSSLVLETTFIANEQLWVVDPLLRTTKFYDVGAAVPNGYYTRVEIKLPTDLSAWVRPGWWYRWDLQATNLDFTPVLRKTHLRGRARVFSQSTML